MFEIVPSYNWILTEKICMRQVSVQYQLRLHYQTELLDQQSLDLNYFFLFLFKVNPHLWGFHCFSTKTEALIKNL